MKKLLAWRPSSPGKEDAQEPRTRAPSGPLETIISSASYLSRQSSSASSASSSCPSTYSPPPPDRRRKRRHTAESLEESNSRSVGAVGPSLSKAIGTSTRRKTLLPWLYSSEGKEDEEAEETKEESKQESSQQHEVQRKALEKEETKEYKETRHVGEEVIVSRHSEDDFLNISVGDYNYVEDDPSISPTSTAPSVGKETAEAPTAFRETWAQRGSLGGGGGRASQGRTGRGKATPSTSSMSSLSSSFASHMSSSSGWMRRKAGGPTPLQPPLSPPGSSSPGFAPHRLSSSPPRRSSLGQFTLPSVDRRARWSPRRGSPRSPTSSREGTGSSIASTLALGEYFAGKDGPPDILQPGFSNDDGYQSTGLLSSLAHALSLKRIAINLRKNQKSLTRVTNQPDRTWRGSFKDKELESEYQDFSSRRVHVFFGSLIAAVLAVAQLVLLLLTDGAPNSCLYLLTYIPFLFFGLIWFLNSRRAHKFWKMVILGILAAQISLLFAQEFWIMRVHDNEMQQPTNAAAVLSAYSQESSPSSPSLFTSFSWDSLASAPSSVLSRQLLSADDLIILLEFHALLLAVVLMSAAANLGFFGPTALLVLGFAFEIALWSEAHWPTSSSTTPSSSSTPAPSTASLRGAFTETNPLSQRSFSLLDQESPEVKASHHLQIQVLFILALTNVLMIWPIAVLDWRNRRMFLLLQRMTSVIARQGEQLDEYEAQLKFLEYRSEEKSVIEKVLVQDDAIQPYMIPFEEIQFDRIVGSGGFGEVIAGRFLETPVAIKRLLRNRITEEHIEDFKAEIRMLSELRHPNIVQFIGASWDSYSNICIVTEYMEKGSLSHVLPTFHHATWMDPKLRMAADIALGLAYLHGRRLPIIHRDLKSSNVLVSETYGCKLADFGLSREVIPEETMTVTGSVCWMAPELIRSEKYSSQADMYSFGVLLTELDTHKLPFADVVDEEGRKMGGGKLFHKVGYEGLRPQPSPMCPKSLKAFIERCLSGDPEQRPTAQEAAIAFEDELRKAVREEVLKAEEEEQELATLEGGLPHKLMIRKFSSYLMFPKQKDLK